MLFIKQRLIVVLCGAFVLLGIAGCADTKGETALQVVAKHDGIKYFDIDTNGKIYPAPEFQADTNEIYTVPLSSFNKDSHGKAVSLADKLTMQSASGQSETPDAKTLSLLQGAIAKRATVLFEVQIFKHDSKRFVAIYHNAGTSDIAYLYTLGDDNSVREIANISGYEIIGVKL